MKRRLTVQILTLALAALLLLPLLSSCKLKELGFDVLAPAPNSGESLYEAMLDNLNVAENVTIRTEMTYEAPMPGDMTYRASYTATEVFTDPWEESMLLSYDATVTTEYRSGGLQVCSASSDSGYRDEYRYRKGFADGYMFRECASGGLANRSKTPITAEEYSEFVNYTYEDNFVHYLNYDECMTAVHRKLEDGSWELRFAGLCEEDLNDLDVLYGPDFSCVSDYVYIVDASVTVIATPDYRFHTARVVLNYAEYDEEGYFLRDYPAVTYSLTFEETAAVTAADIRLETYSDIGDLRKLTAFANALDRRAYAERGRYTYKNSEYWMMDGEESFCKEDQSIRFDFTIKGEFIYENQGSYETAEESWLLTESYKNGVMTYKDTNQMTGEEEESRFDTTPDEILWNLAYLMWPAEYNDLNVERIECLDEKEGMYRLHIGLWHRQGYEESCAVEGTTLTAYTAYLDFTLRSDVLLEYDYHLEITAQREDGTVDTYRREISWSFEKAQSLKP
ncbi:MAG: hypothetical protein J6K29_00750 [Clostridia bacterium]|nr:hypothetical protein [Clostridia bacterium]